MSDDIELNPGPSEQSNQNNTTFTFTVLLKVRLKLRTGPLADFHSCFTSVKCYIETTSIEHMPESDSRQRFVESNTKNSWIDCLMNTPFVFAMDMW